MTTAVYAQVSESPGSVNCPPTVSLTVTVTTEDGAVIPNALVILREDILGQPRDVKAFESELQTDANGKTIAAVPCNYLDVFVAANGFAPAAQKFLITRDARTLSIPLKMYPISRTTELPIPQPEPSSVMAPLPSRVPESAHSLTQSGPTITVDEAKQLVGTVLHHQKFPSSSPYCSIENLDRNGKPFEVGYYAFAASCDFPNTQATSPWGYISCQSSNGRCAELRHLQMGRVPRPAPTSKANHASNWRDCRRGEEVSRGYGLRQNEVASGSLQLIAGRVRRIAAGCTQQ